MPLDTSIVLAAEQHRRFELATVDAIVHATAVYAGADLLTCDRRFADLPGVALFARA